MQIEVRALLNDTVGTLACGRYSDSNVLMGIILGTGTNGCYVEKVGQIHKLAGDPERNPSSSMVVNMEWGGYISPLLPMTADDYASDAAGANPGKCFFEKLISGMFMGEAVSFLLPCKPDHFCPKSLLLPKIIDFWLGLCVLPFSGMDFGYSVGISDSELYMRSVSFRKTSKTYLSKSMLQYVQCNLSQKLRQMPH